eukprot:gb/GECH01006788.1/.p1 GENE.gb/GECH01006788.1/~~gb/GECH01006788.1/.p1  ORF type:complete len:385 (+),score=65.98 gb/GECH01006788.1/:1-1155(+)
MDNNRFQYPSKLYIRRGIHRIAAVQCAMRQRLAYPLLFGGGDGSVSSRYILRSSSRISSLVLRHASFHHIFRRSSSPSYLCDVTAIIYHRYVCGVFDSISCLCGGTGFYSIFRVYEHVTKDRYHIFLVALWIALLFMFLLPLLMSSEHNHNYHNSKKKKKNEDIEKEKISSDSKLKQILRRKYFHLLAVFMFIPGCILKPSFMYLSYGVALSAMIIFECARLQLNATPIGIRIDTFMRRFTDRRDGGTLILTHIYLLCGCALPLWIEFSSMPTDIPLLEMTAAVGVIILGIGDSMASICGVYFGGIRWPIRDNPKTFIGTLAAFLATLAGTLGMAWSAAVPITPTSVMHYTVTAAAVCVFEAITLQIDNLVLPLLFYALVKVFV